MNLRQIEIFHAVFLHGTVSAAARSLNVSQPSVTKVLRHAERSIGLTLFERSTGRLIPTLDARTLFAEVSDIQDRVRSLRQACQNLRHGRGRHILFAVDDHQFALADHLMGDGSRQRHFETDRDVGFMLIELSLIHI